MINYNNIIGCSADTPSDMRTIRNLIAANTHRLNNNTFTTSNNVSLMWNDWTHHIESVIDNSTPQLFVNQFIRSPVSYINLRNSRALDAGGISREFFTTILQTAISKVFGHTGRSRFGLPIRLIPWNETIAMDVVVTMGSYLVKMRGGFGNMLHPVVTLVMVGDLDTNTLHSLTPNETRAHLRIWLDNRIEANESIFNFTVGDVHLHPELDALLFESHFNSTDQQRLNAMQNETQVLMYIWNHLVDVMSPFLNILQRNMVPTLNWIANLNEPRVPNQQIRRFVETGLPITTEDMISVVERARVSDDSEDNVDIVRPWIREWLLDRGNDVIAFNDNEEPRFMTASQRLCQWVTGERFLTSPVRMSFGTIRSTDVAFTANTMYAQTCTNTLKVMLVMNQAMNREQFMNGMNAILLSSDRSSTASFVGAP